jgi:hypothetical protein
VSTEPIVTTAAPLPAAARCPACGAALGTGQRYCLECGERVVPTSSVLAGGPAAAGPATPPAPPGLVPERGPAQNTTLIALAGVGVLLLAMGVGVLIGRASAGKQSAPPAQTISLAPGTGTSTTPASEATFTSDWPSGTSGFTVQLQTLPAGSTVSAIDAAKSAATAKGASGVGALKTEEFLSLSGSGYLVYSGVYHSRAAAQKALAGLKGKFPGASVREVSNKAASSGSSGAGAGAGAAKGGAGSNINHPAPPSVLEGLKSTHGKSYVERSKNLPDVVETG